MAVINQITYNGVTYTEDDVTGWDEKLSVADKTELENLLYDISVLDPEEEGQIWIDTLNWIDVSKVTDMSSVFSDGQDYAGVMYEGDISQWDVSNVTNMDGMFYRSRGNFDISGWDVGNVESMGLMFEGATNFNQDLSTWCVEKIQTKPDRFDDGANAWVLPRPNWGTCPEPPEPPNPDPSDDRPGEWHVLLPR